MSRPSVGACTYGVLEDGDTRDEQDMQPLSVLHQNTTTLTLFFYSRRIRDKNNSCSFFTEVTPTLLELLARPHDHFRHPE